MPEINIYLTNREYQRVIDCISNNGKTDMDSETFSGTELKIALTPFGNSLEVKGYTSCEIDDVLVEFKKD